MKKENLETADFEFRNNFERIRFPHFLLFCHRARPKHFDNHMAKILKCHWLTTRTDGPTHNRRFNAEVKIFLFLSVATTLIKNNSDALGVSLTHSPPIRQGGNYFVYYVMIRETDPLPHCSFTNTFPRK